MLTRREFLKLIFSMLCIPKPPGIDTTGTQMYGREWVFPLAFPAWFPVEPPDSPKYEIHIPVARNG